MAKITIEMYNALKKALPPEAVTKHPTKTYLSSIKAIYVVERLNDVFGVGSWKLTTQKESINEKGMVVVKSIFTIPEYDVYLESFGGNDNGGENSKNFDLGDAYKGATTDSLTKIGSYLGIGMSVFKGQGNIDAKQVKTFSEAENKIKNCTTLEELKNTFAALTAEEKYHVNEIKEQLKTELK